jgi:UDP-glucose 4-epimerase
MMALINEPRAAGEVFNIGNGEEISIRDLALKVRQMTDSRSELRFVSYEQAFDGAFEDMPRRVPDITKLRHFVGYEPRVQLEGIIDSVVRYWTESERAEVRRARREGRSRTSPVLRARRAVA